MRSFYPSEIPATWGFLIFILAVYAGQLAIAGSLAYDAGASAVSQLPNLGFCLFNPWMHTDHIHIGNNILAFAFLGWWTERKIATWKFALMVIGAGYLTNLLPLLTGYGGHTVGISGVTNLFWTFSIVSQIGFVRKLAHSDSIDRRTSFIHLVMFILGFLPSSVL